MSADMSVAEDRVSDHEFIGVYMHPDDDECTHRADGTDLTYCGLTRDEHETTPVTAPEDDRPVGEVPPEVYGKPFHGWACTCFQMAPQYARLPDPDRPCPIHTPEDDRPVGEVPPTHPESYCHRCDGPNVSWWVPSPVWNLVMGYPKQAYDGIVCPLCFVALAEARGARGPWRLAPRVWPNDVALVHVDGRVWDEVAERWVVEVDVNRQSEEVEALREQVAHRDTLLDNAARLLAALPNPDPYQALLTQLHEARTDRQQTAEENRDLLAENLRLRAGIEGLAPCADLLLAAEASWGGWAHNYAKLGRSLRALLDGEVRP